MPSVRWSRTLAIVGGGFSAIALVGWLVNLPILASFHSGFMSGYAEPSVRTGLPVDAEWLEKPFTARALLKRVRDVLSLGGETRIS